MQRIIKHSLIFEITVYKSVVSSFIEINFILDETLPDKSAFILELPTILNLQPIHCKIE
jgi:hypothetical protein